MRVKAAEERLTNIRKAEALARVEGLLRLAKLKSKYIKQQG